MHENAPVLFVTREPRSHFVIGWPPNTRDATGVDTENPAPVTSTRAPAGPWDGAEPMRGEVTANDTGALCMPVARSVPSRG
jgi:hypothetical protein